MKEFVIVIGSPNSGKSTVIASITGCPTRTYRERVYDTYSNRNIMVVASSPQEDHLSLRELKLYLKSVKADRRCNGMIMAVQPTKTTVRLSLRKIIQEVQSTRSFNLHLFVLDPPYNDSLRTRSVIPNVSYHLRGLGINYRVLDGSKFAFINAREINRMSRLV